MKKFKIIYRADNPAERALNAFFKKSEEKLPAQGAINADVIRALVLNKDWTRFKMKQIKPKKGKELSTLVEYIRQRAEASDRAFFKSLGRALSKEPKNNTEIEDFLFMNWDITHGSMGEGPGLKCFIDDAVVDLLKILFGDRAPSLAAYREIRKAAGLPQEPPKIRRVTLERDGITLHPVR